MSTPSTGIDSIPERPRTLAEKVWDDHLVVKGEGGQPDLIYIDLHLVHEVTSPQAFDGLRAEGRPVRRLDLTIATEDHNTPTLDIDKPIADLTSRTQIETLRRNAAEFGVRLVRSAIGLSMSHVGVLWSSVAIVRSRRRTGRPSARSPSKACGLVTSCTR